jgi:hypothetical protein
MVSRNWSYFANRTTAARQMSRHVPSHATPVTILGPILKRVYHFLFDMTNTISLSEAACLYDTQTNSAYSNNVSTNIEQKEDLAVKLEHTFQRLKDS